MTIAELRRRDVLRLVERRTADATAAEIETETKEARHTMTLFYRFAAAYQRSFYTEQDRNATQAEKDRADEKSEKAYKRAAESLKKYGLKISCPGLYPIIEHESGGHWSMGHFYN